jgi:hypothetical protein
MGIGSKNNRKQKEGNPQRADARSLAQNSPTYK